MGRGILVSLVVVATAGSALAQPKSEAVPLLGAQPQLKATASTGFVDDLVGADSNRFIYVIADGTSKAALHVATLEAGKVHDGATSAEQIVDISTITLQPLSLHVVGERVLVVGISEGKQVAALVELSDKDKKKPAGTTIYKVGPADHITVITRDGKPRIAVHKAVEKAGNVKHTTELFAIENGKRVQGGKSLELDAAGTDKKLEFKVNHWSDGWTRAYGIKAGVWDKKEDQRAPDSETSFDLVTGKLEQKKIEDLFDQKRRFAALAESGGGKLDFIRLAAKNDNIELWRNGKSRVLELDQPLTNYDPKSLQGIINADGTGWIALKVDPVNADAVARKRADPEYLDIFRFADGGKATRRARVLAKGLRHRFGTTGDRFWLIERNAGFERGGKMITLYQLQ
jgi:hypothetical protein